MVDIGKMNRRITFLRLEATEDEMGQDKSEWKTYRTVWATIKPYKSSEYNFMSKLKPEVTHRVYIRYSIAGPPLDMDDQHRMLEIQCEEVFENVKYQF